MRCRKKDFAPQCFWTANERTRLKQCISYRPSALIRRSACWVYNFKKAGLSRGQAVNKWGVFRLYCITALRVLNKCAQIACVCVCVGGWVGVWIFPCHWMMATGFTWKQYLSWTCILLVRTPDPSTILAWGMSSQQTERTVCLDLTFWSPDPTLLSVSQGCTMKIDCDMSGDMSRLFLHVVSVLALKI